ncbi:hypothetical protein AWM70_21205 [Paenibacillus yonginensis]|uniref:Uncharacterized protein n=1 Tax=Paenibacillus yonginensis TaxID=1462996 RepID=A0A1B1N5U2_9BACL|nr:hypothetical protein [Paenibacillus yonginensis]ANS76789.1 hypothetical protein AWM70_21205 [Paenibacillus yonginensis]
MGIWFGYISLFVFLMVIVFMPKILSLREIYLTWGWMSFLTLFTDLIFGAVLDLYDFVGPGISFADLFLEAALPASYGIITANFLPEKNSNFIWYLLGVIVTALLYEWLSLEAGYLVYKGWKLIYSIPVYILGTLFLRWHLRFIRSGN